MKKQLILLFTLPLILAGCDFENPTNNNNQENNQTTENGANSGTSQTAEETTGGGTSGGNSGQSGNGNTSSQWTTSWTGIQYDIAYAMFKGNLPCLKAFNGYTTSDMSGSTIPVFNPYIKGWSKESQTYYDGALRDMGYQFLEDIVDEDGDLTKYYQKGTYKVQTCHYRNSSGDYYFDVFAYNDYHAPFQLDYVPAVDLTVDVYNPKSGYKAFSKTINGITFNCSSATKNNNCIQLNKNSTMEISGKTFSKMDVLFMKDAYSFLVYAGSSSSNAKIVYNDGGHWDLPSGTKYIKIQSLDGTPQIDCLSIL